VSDAIRYGSALGGVIAKLRRGERLDDAAIDEIERACDVLRGEGWGGGLPMDDAIKALIRDE